jgi:hypothetical protein
VPQQKLLLRLMLRQLGDAVGPFFAPRPSARTLAAGGPGAVQALESFKEMVFDWVLAVRGPAKRLFRAEFSIPTAATNRESVMG